MNKVRKKLKQKKLYLDDGKTIANMNVDGMPYYAKHKAKTCKDATSFTKKDIKALIVEAYKAYLPMFAVCIAGFSLAYLFIRFVWLQ